MRAQEIPIVNRMAYPLLNSEGGHASVIVCHYLGYKSVHFIFIWISPKTNGLFSFSIVSS